MAIKPEDCLKITEAEKNTVAAFEKEIDSILRDKFISYSSTVQIPIVININQRVLTELLTIYRNAGWSVTESGVTEGGGKYITFKQATRSMYPTDKD